MKAIIIFYSYTGNTERIAEALSEYLRDKYEIKVLKIEALDESVLFIGQAARALMHKKAMIASTESDLSGYDLICFGTPVWAFGPAPAMNTYLNQCRGIEDKNIILFTTYGSGTGVGRCLNYMQEILLQKRAKGFSKFSVQASQIKDTEVVNNIVKDSVQL